MQSKDNKVVSKVSKKKCSDENESLIDDKTNKATNVKADITDKIELVIQQLEEVILRFEQASNKSINSLSEPLEALNKVNYVLNRIPEKIGESVNGLVPEISQAVYTQMLDDFDNVMSERTKKLEDFDNSLDEMLIKLEDHNTKALKKCLLKFALNAFMLIGIASGTTYFMLQKFPSKIIINDNNNIEISGSDVTVWGKGLKIIEKIKDKKI